MIAWFIEVSFDSLLHSNQIIREEYFDVSRTVLFAADETQRKFAHGWETKTKQNLFLDFSVTRISKYLKLVANDVLVCHLDWILILMMFTVGSSALWCWSRVTYVYITSCCYSSVNFKLCVTNDIQFTIFYVVYDTRIMYVLRILHIIFFSPRINLKLVASDVCICFTGKSSPFVPLFDWDFRILFVIKFGCLFTFTSSSKRWMNPNPTHVIWLLQ